MNIDEIALVVDWDTVNFLTQLKFNMSAVEWLDRQKIQGLWTSQHRLKKHGILLPRTVKWYVLGKIADRLGVQMEQLIDREYYRRKSPGIVGYPLVCGCWRQGIKPSDLFPDKVKKKVPNLYYSVYGNMIRTDWHYVRYDCTLNFHVLQEMCKRAGVPMYKLIAVPTAGGADEGRTYGLATLLSILQQEDLAVLGGTAMLLAKQMTDEERVAQFAALLQKRREFCERPPS